MTATGTGTGTVCCSRIEEFYQSTNLSTYIGECIMHGSDATRSCFEWPHLCPFGSCMCAETPLAGLCLAVDVVTHHVTLSQAVLQFLVAWRTAISSTAAAPVLPPI